MTKRKPIMKTILVLKDKDGNSKDPKTGYPYGWFPRGEIVNCGAYCIDTT